MNILLAIGIATIIGFIGGKLFNQLKIPAVTGWVIVGVIMGSSVTGIFPEKLLSRIEIIYDIALGLIAFSIGEELIFPKLKQLGKKIAAIVIFEAFGAFFIVSSVVFLLTDSLPQALILGAVSSATAPAATVMVIHELKAKGELTTTIISVVAIDDAIALILYAFASSAARIFILPDAHISLLSMILKPFEEILGAVLVGCVVGLLVSFFSRFIKSSIDFFVVVIGSILITTGVSNFLEFSPLLANMSLGMVISNFAPRSLRRISNIWQSSTPIIYIMFFCLAGAHLNLKVISQIGILGLSYTAARMAGKFLGASFGAKISKAGKKVQRFVGLSLFPQVGVALALAV
ncbi:cation:proton antiporter, partial [Candidatus Aerophobetes bacterium]|nr:cation:proton antiporter [Candidatus Aerophobetes bacterium]